ncbi:MAG: M28 family metallopeptidase [Gemmatimonadota bacterium]|nr:M28 family metallopeptidase [Gemmatimonadota bacterium]
MHPRTRIIVGAAILAALTAARASKAQNYPLLDSTVTTRITAEISGDAAYDHIRAMSGHRPQGSDTLYLTAQYVERMASAAGLQQVRLIMQRSARSTWNPGTSDLWIVDAAGAPVERIASSIQMRLHLADRSRPADVTAELVDVGAGRAADLDAKNVAGKIVLTYGSLNSVMREAVIRRGAAGVVWYPDPYTPSRGFLSFGIDQPDVVPWFTIDTAAVDGKLPTFAFILSLRQALPLHNRLAASRTPLRVHAVVRSELGSQVHPAPWMPMVEAMIPGRDAGAGQDIVLTGHLQEGEHSANDDASGCASMLEIARALSKMIAEGTLPRPRRTIRFWWTTENDGERRYFADNPAVIRSLWVDINQDMVGANEALDVMRTQDVSRVPFSRFHFLNDVMESVVDYMVAGNSSNITHYRNGYGLYPKPHVSQNGSLHRYNAQAIWYIGDSDHESFINAPIGIPAVSFMNSPDRYIHSNLDDLWQIDRTQLGRNAAASALIAYTMATSDSLSFDAIAAEVIGRGEARLGGAVRIALQHVAGATDKGVACAEALDQIWYGIERERKGIRSLGEMTATSPARTVPLLADLDRRRLQAEREVRAACPKTPSTRAQSEAERALAAMRPAIAGGPVEWLAAHEGMPFPDGVNEYLLREMLAAIDGTRTGLDLYRLAASEVREAGTPYYGSITPEITLGWLRGVERLGLIKQVK